MSIASIATSESPSQFKPDMAFKSLLQNLPAGAYTCDVNGLITYYNDRAAQVWGRAPELLDENERWCGSFKLLTTDGIPIPHSDCWMALAIKNKKGYNGREIVIERPDGERWTVLVHANPIFNDDGDVIGAVNVVVDITERKNFENRLSENKKELENLFNNAAVGIHWVGPDGIIHRANEAELRMLGYTKEEYVGRHIADFHVDQDVIKDILTRLKAGETLHEYEARLRCKDGTIKTVLITSNVHWKKGRFIHTNCFTIDVTERKRAEELLKQSDRRKDDFLAVLAHELRNPLAPIQNAADVLNLSNVQTEQEKWALGIIGRQVNQMTHLIDDLLDISRITRNKLELKKERIDLLDAVQVAIETSCSHMRESGIRFNVDMPDKPVYVIGDNVRLGQIVANLLNNAAKYTNNGGRVDLTLGVNEGSQEAEIRVCDTGIGIEPDMIKSIFDIFVQGHKENGMPRDGLGIGLTLVHNLVEMHGGTIFAESEGRGHGSTFTVRLPIIQDQTEVSRDPRQEKMALSKIFNVLVIDDNKDAAETMEKLLKSHNCNVQTGYDGMEALDLANTFRPDVVLLDIGMPKIDGLEVARLIRKEPWGKKMVLIATTGWGQDSDRKRSAEAGFDHHLVKPMRIHDILTIFEGIAKEGSFRNTAT